MPDHHSSHQDNLKSFRLTPKSLLKAIGLSIFLCIIFLWSAHAIVHSIDYKNSDFFTLWLAGRMVWTGENPYSSENWVNAHLKYGVTWISNNISPYPLAVGLLFAPLGRLSLHEAYIIWVFASQVMIILSLFVLLSMFPDTRVKYYLLPSILAAFLFRPTIVTFRNGQLSAWLLWIICIAILLWYYRLWFWGGLVLGLLALKPTIGGPILLVVSLWLLWQKHFRAILGLSITLLASFLVGFYFDPNWVKHFLQIGNRKLTMTFGDSPTIWGIGSAFCHRQFYCTVTVGGFLTLLISIALLYYIWKYRHALSPLAVLGLIIPWTILITPYIWAYDQTILLIPITAMTMNWIKKGWPFLTIALIPIGLSILSIGLIFVALQIGRDIWSSILPLLILLLSLWSWQISQGAQVSS